MLKFGDGTSRVGAVLVAGFAFIGITNLVGCQKKDQPSGVAPAASSAVPNANTAPSGSSAASEEGPLEKVEAGHIGELPSLAEEFHAAKGLGLLDAWSKAAPLKPRKFDGMKPGETSIAVGEFLVDAAAAAADDKKPISPEVMDQARTAVKALNPPAAIMQRIDVFADSLKNEGKDEKAQRREVDRFVAASLGTMQIDPSTKKDPALVNKVNLAMLGGYLRSLAITSKVLASTPAPDKDKLGLLARKQEQAYFFAFLQNQLDPSLKSEPAVQRALDALTKIAPNVQKSDPTVDDAKAIAGALQQYAS